MMGKQNNNLFQRLKNKTELSTQNYEDLKKSSFRVKFIIFLVTVIICACFFSFHFNQQTKETPLNNIAIGYVWPTQSIVAEFTFPIFKEDNQYQDELDSVSDNAIKVFFYDDIAHKNAQEYLDSLINRAINKDSEKETQEITDNFTRKEIDDFFELKSNINLKELRT